MGAGVATSPHWPGPLRRTLRPIAVAQTGRPPKGSELPAGMPLTQCLAPKGLSSAGGIPRSACHRLRRCPALLVRRPARTCSFSPFGSPPHAPACRLFCPVLFRRTSLGHGRKVSSLPSRAKRIPPVDNKDIGDKNGPPAALLFRGRRSGDLVPRHARITIFLADLRVRQTRPARDFRRKGDLSRRRCSGMRVGMEASFSSRTVRPIQAPDRRPRPSA